MWLAVWPGVVTASSVKPLPLTIAPSVSATSGRKSVSALASSGLSFADIERTRGAMRAFAIGLGAGRLHDMRHRRRMIAMRMRDEDMADGLAADRVEQRGNVFAVVRARIDDRDLAAPDDIGDRSLEGERARHCRRIMRGCRARPPSPRPGRGRNFCRRECLRSFNQPNMAAPARPGLRHAAKPNIRS